MYERLNGKFYFQNSSDKEYSLCQKVYTGNTSGISIYEMIQSVLIHKSLVVEGNSNGRQADLLVHIAPRFTTYLSKGFVFELSTSRPS
jgi:hypothetical protein